MHGNLAASIVPVSVFVSVELQVCLDGFPWKPGLLRFAWGVRGCKCPVGDEDGEKGKEGKEYPCLETTADLRFYVVGNDQEQGAEEDVAEGVTARTVGGEWSIFDSRIL